MLSVEDLTEYGEVNAGEARNLNGSRSCAWQRDYEAGGHEGFVISLDVWGEHSIDDMKSVSDNTAEVEVNGRPAVRLTNPDRGYCTVGLKLDDTSRIDVGINGFSDYQDSCQVAEDVVYLVEPRLPDLPS
ncbi:Protein of unknown function (DUF3558) [Saccharomonospora azurea NA-128]|uniref:Uncharacterized protein n=1 Tax=Saccharomonospora azurea NA-128 TaxID=882081 RepID=H8G538_9PSEU|nr:Protein of unknown function (DUF3558) [Saccharomonospora azurea NA-128]